MTAPTAEERERREYADGTNLPLAEALAETDDRMNEALADLEQTLSEALVEIDDLLRENEEIQS